MELPLHVALRSFGGIDIGMINPPYSLDKKDKSVVREYADVQKIRELEDKISKLTKQSKDLKKKDAVYNKSEIANIEKEITKFSKQIESMTENVKIFISHIIRNESKNNYMAFARELNAHVRTDFVIKLPSLKPGVPDCEFMDKYIENLKRDFSSVPDYFLNEGYDKAFWYLDNINQEDFERDYAGISVAKSIALSDREWDYFTLEDIVSSVHNGKSYNASDLVVSDGEEYVSYVTRTDENNGVSMYVQALDYQGLEKANAITIGDTTATIFFQEHEFITGPHIIVIRADWLNVYTANFIITILNQEKYRYPVFGRAFTKDLIKQTKVYLPIDKDGNPDYQFMEDYIKSLPFSKKI